MKSLKEFNEAANRRYEEAMRYPKPNGILCECGKELSDLDNMILASNPPKKNVGCSSCGFRGYRTV